MPRSFRLVNLKTVNVGVLNHLVDFFADIEYKPDDDYLPSIGVIRLRVPTTSWVFLNSREEGFAEKRLCYYAIQKLKGALALPEPKLSFELEPTQDELTKIIKIDATKIEPNKWVTIDEKPKLLSQKVFISCGQYHKNEKQLGEQIKQIIDNTYGFEGYFAEYQQSLDGLTKNIFDALHTAAAFIAVMHRRDVISTDDYRGSVWIEQEIAIAAFMTQTLNLPLKVKAYVQNGIKLEGVRGLILLNPKRFETDEEVIDDFKKTIPQVLAQIKPVEEPWYMI